MATCGTYSQIEKNSVLSDINNVYWRGYCIGKVLGSGAFGQVFAAVRNSDNLPVAIKRLPKEKILSWIERNGRVIPAEVDYMRQLSHVSGVIQLLDVHDVDGDFYIVMERLESGTNLYELLGQREIFTESVVRHLFRQVVKAVVGCYREGIIHGDIKAENLIVDMKNLQIRLIDFGYSSPCQMMPVPIFRGTLGFAPPEWFEEGLCYAVPNAVWSLGIVLCEMATGISPLEDEARETGQWVDLGSLPASPLCRDLIQRLLARRPEQRFTLLQILNHPWFHEEQSVSIANGQSNRSHKTQFNSFASPRCTEHLVGTGTSCGSASSVASSGYSSAFEL